MSVVRSFRVENHRLAGVAFAESPNTNGRRMRPEVLVMHYTAGAGNAVRWLCNPAAMASAHVVISRTGQVTQLVPLDTVAWHAGASAWNGRRHVNDFSLGIELENWGYLTPTDDPERLATWTGARIERGIAFEGRHENRAWPYQYWERFPGPQMEAAVWVARAICRAYGIGAIVGHDDVSPGRKADPGPAFPKACFVAGVLGK